MDISEAFEKRDSFFKWFVIASLAEMDITEEMRTRPLDLTLTLNGVELNPVRAIERLHKEYERQVKVQAHIFFEESIDKTLNPFHEKMEELSKAVNRMIKNMPLREQ